MSEWINVKTNPPPKGEVVLVIEHTFDYIDQITRYTLAVRPFLTHDFGDIVWVLSGGVLRVGGYKYWMKIPEHPND